eukprot:CAMPEP_0174270162 /NCGR_PEP_ID=MMETSP0439-20130205/43503_1 /TAXON_ID=0 /ORGANISM="Stereomyxa ramosa, Strain Chinc5" /LENGTH=157 /DNA_ID=CAMNT_0015359329 /DNA_START=48 /DNA_END=521 /DNA_ORIENTATION=+
MSQHNGQPIQAVKSCGFLIFSKNEQGTPVFLLMKHRNRYDLPKGHQEAGETDMMTAFRELEEETGIKKEEVKVQDGFEYKTVYYPTYKRFGGKKVEKTFVIYVGYISQQKEIQLTEHIGCEWFSWPAGRIQRSVDPILSSFATFLKRKRVALPDLLG